MDQLLANHAAQVGIVLLIILQLGGVILQMAVNLKILRDKPPTNGVSGEQLEARLAAFRAEQEREDALRMRVVETRLDGLFQFMQRLENRMENTTHRSTIINPQT